MNNLKYLLILLILLIPLGCGEEGAASVDVVKKRITSQIKNMIGKGDIAITKYENKIKAVRASLIKMKVSHKDFENKLRDKKLELAKLEQKAENAEEKTDLQTRKIELFRNHVQDMEGFLKQLGSTEIKLGETYQKLVDNLDIVKLKIASLEAKRDMLSAMRTVQEYANIDTDISSIGGSLESTVSDMQKDIYAVEAEMEVDKLISRSKSL